MDKQELYGKINQLPSILGWKGHGAKVMIAKDSVLELVRQLDEPQKVVIPPLIAGYIVQCQSYGMTLNRVLTDIESGCEDRVAKNVQDWLFRQENQEAFVRAWLDGYTIEKEKLYTVIIPHSQNHRGQVQYLCKQGKNWFFCGNDINRFKTKFTKGQIEAAGFGWVFEQEFAKEVGL